MNTAIFHTPGLLSGSRHGGPFSLEMKEDGGVITGVALETGYTHRGIERCLQELNYYQGLLFCDRVDFLSAPACNAAFALAVEALGGVEVPDRAQYVRVILLELSRISSHLFFLFQLTKDLGAANISCFAVRERELYNDLFELYCGSRLGFGAIRIGGVVENATDGFLYRIENALLSTETFLAEIKDSFTHNPILRNRLEGIGLITKESVVKHGITGPNARASGVDLDLRWSSPYAAYSRMRHELVQLEYATGDAYARVLYRLEEIRASILLVKRALEKIPSGNHCNPVSMDFAPPQGDACVFVESPRGQFGVYIESDGSSRPLRAKFATPSFLHMRYAATLLLEERVEDAFILFDSLDVSVSEVDR